MSQTAQRYVVDLTFARKTDRKYSSFFRWAARAILKELKFKAAALSILLVRDRAMARLNQKLMRHRGTTDVLSFSYLEKKGKVVLTAKVLAADPPAFLGEIIICIDTAERNSREFKTSLKYESALYLCHGILHCLGYEDKTKKGFLEMQKKQNEILKRFTVARSAESK